MNFKKITKVVLTVAGLIMSSVPATAMNFYWDPTTHYLNLSGPVIPSDSDTFFNMLEKHHVERVTLGPSLGGDAESGLVISQTIFMNHIPTENIDICASACAFMFAGGRDSTMYVDNNTEYFVLAHCAEGVANIESGVFSLTDQDIFYTKNLLYAMGFNDKFTDDYVKLCDKKDNNNTFNFEGFLIQHGFDIKYIDTPVLNHGSNDDTQ